MPETQETNDNQDKASNKKKWRPRAWFWFVLYGVLVLTGLSIGSWYFEKGADRAKFWVEGLLSAGVLSVVIVQAVIYRKQWNAMQEGLKVSRKSMRYSQSAYVTVKDVTVIWEIGKPLQFVIRFTNTGTTPAYNMRVYAHVTNEDKPFTFTHEQAKDLQGAEVSQSILGANGARSHTRLTSQPYLGNYYLCRRVQT